MVRHKVSGTQGRSQVFIVGGQVGPYKFVKNIFRQISIKYL